MDGLVVDFDGKKNVVMYQGLKEYPIGGMIAEYARIHPTEIKDVILEYGELSKPATEEFLGPFFPWFINKLEEKFGTIAAIMITIEFMSFTVNLLKMDVSEQEEIFENSMESYGKVGEFIFSGTNYNEPGTESVEQLLLSCYLIYSDSFVGFKHSFNLLAMDEVVDDNQTDIFFSFFGENIDMQHIDFKIACYEGKFHSLYTLKSSMSLFLFEAAHCLDKEVTFRRCANCGNYFVPEGRSDTIYCNHKSLQHEGKTCKEVGAQITRSNKEKNDIVTKEYRKVYMRYKMITLRHPEDRESKKKFDVLTDEIKSWRKNLLNGSATVDQFLEWLNEF